MTAALNWILAMTPAIIDLAKAAGSMLVEGFQFAANAVDGFLLKLTPAWQEAKDSLSGFAAALAAGDIPAAASVLWATLKLRWAQGTKAISDEWAIWSKGFLDTFANAMTAIQQLWQQTSHWLAKGIVELMGRVDSSINVEAVQAELEIINQQEQSRITREAEQCRPRGITDSNSVSHRQRPILKPQKRHGRKLWRKRTQQASEPQTNRQRQPLRRTNSANSFAT